jgi:signal transduction histidine kinase/CheY-like chemotaxis protein
MSLPLPVPILLVDDRPANLLALEALLASPEHEIVTVPSGDDALTQIAQRDFALVLLDVQMPTMDGFETASKMRHYLGERGRQVPIVFVTGIDSSPARVLQAYAAGGAVDFIQKPVEAEVIRAKVAVFVALHRARERLVLERQEARRRLNALTELALGLSSARRRDEVATVIVDHGMRAAVADTCTLYTLDESETALELIGQRGTAPEVVDRIRRISETEGNPASFATFRAGTSTWAESEEDYRRIFPAVAAMKADGKRARAFWSMPLIVEGRPVGLLGMGFYEPRTFSPEERAFVGAFTQQCAQALLRVLRLAREEEARTIEARDRMRSAFLARAGEALVSSLDYESTLTTVAQLAVLGLADWCTIDLVEPGATTPRQVTVAHTDPKKVEYARKLGERYPPDRNAPTGSPQVIRSGKSELYKEIPAALVEAGAKDAEHLRIIRELRLESAMVVPLRARTRVLGAITLIYADSGRRYTDDDLAFAEDFARRAAMAIENATALRETEEARAREQALRAEAEANGQFREVFLGILGHDLRNPLGAIDMAAALLRRNAEARETKLLDRMVLSSRRMSRMIEQILDLTRSRVGGGLELKPAPINLAEVLTLVIDELRVAHPARALELRSPPSLPGAWDRDRLEQVFSNLVSNALQYGLASSPVTVEARDEGASVGIKVHNDGPPIAEDLRLRLFDPFRRGARDSRTSHTQGLGLGLFISREIVVAHDGTIEVQSNATDGTTFYVTLPRTKSALPSNEATPR